jgi:hypothetical protein
LYRSWAGSRTKTHTLNKDTLNKDKTLSLLTTMLLLLLLMLLRPSSASPAGAEEEEWTSDNLMLIYTFLVCILLAAFPEEFGYDMDLLVRLMKARVALPPIERERKTMNTVFQELGPSYTRRAYRMTEEDSFWSLHKLLYAYLRRPAAYKRNRLVMKGATNGLITTPFRLSCAIRYFAGGRPEDISLVHGISHTEVFHSVWMVVDAINQCEELAFTFPEDHGK